MGEARYALRHVDADGREHMWTCIPMSAHWVARWHAKDSDRPTEVLRDVGRGWELVTTWYPDAVAVDHLGDVYRGYDPYDDDDGFDDEGSPYDDWTGWADRDGADPYPCADTWREMVQASLTGVTAELRHEQDDREPFRSVFVRTIIDYEGL